MRKQSIKLFYSRRGVYLSNEVTRQQLRGRPVRGSVGAAAVADDRYLDRDIYQLRQSLARSLPHPPRYACIAQALGRYGRTWPRATRALQPMWELWPLRWLAGRCPCSNTRCSIGQHWAALGRWGKWEQLGGCKSANRQIGKPIWVKSPPLPFAQALAKLAQSSQADPLFTQGSFCPADKHQ